MSKQAQGPATAGGCDPCGPSRRNRYYRDKKLRIADYVLEQEYHIARRRLVNRAMLGWGVVWGFRIDPDALTVGKGMALDAQGRELLACDEVKLGCGENLLWLGPSRCGCGFAVVDPPKQPDAPDAQCPPQSSECASLYLLSAHYAEKRVEHVRLDDGCGDARCEANEVCETVVYSLRPIRCCEAGLPGCRCPRCAGEDNCACDEHEPPRKGDDQQEQERAELRQEPQHGFSLDRGPHRQLALWSLDPLGHFDACKPRRLEKVGCLDLDPDAGVPLACVTIAYRCGEPYVAAIVDSAHPRRLARSNETLFDLIRGCDLTRIGDVGWRDWLPTGRRIVPLSAFQAMFDQPAAAENYTPRRRQPSRGAVTTHFTVAFTGPVRAETLTPDVLTLSLLQRELREDVSDIVRVPIVQLVPFPPEAGDPPQTTRGFTVLVDRAFWEGEINPDDASGFERPTIVEIEIRADWILDCNGQEVAGGGRYPPSTGCVPGGRFLSSFTVCPDDQCEPGSPPTAARDMTQ